MYSNQAIERCVRTAPLKPIAVWQTGAGCPVSISPGSYPVSFGLPDPDPTEKRSSTTLSEDVPSGFVTFLRRPTPNPVIRWIIRRLKPISP